MLLTYAVAAAQGHEGPARNDRRARRLVDVLVASPPFVEHPPGHGKQSHAPGFVSSVTGFRGLQHLVVDSEVIDGLRYAYLARRELGLTGRQAAAIRDRIHRTALGAFWRWPVIRLNQINWYSLVYAANATVTGSPRLLRHDMRLQIERFVARARGTGAVAGNLGAGLHFNYLPHVRASAQKNTDSAEYANITASFLREYVQARRAGMAALSPSARQLLREWLMRVLAGYWTHGGYLNWDTGFGFERWHQAKKLGLSQQALIGIASAPSLAPRRAAPAWAKWMLDRGFGVYERQLARNGGEPPGLLFGVNAVPQQSESARLGLARMTSNAARAIAAGLGSAPARRPPPLYSFDPDTGRLAVTTPAYNTAIVPSARRAYPYGGIDLARLYDGRQEVAAGIGGRPPASFGLLVRDVAGRQRFATQLPDRGRLWLTRAPLGVRARASAWTGRAYAGPFRDLRAAGLARGRGWTGRTSHRFTPELRADELDAVADRGERAGDGRRAVPELGRGRPRDGRPARWRHAPGGLGAPGTSPRRPPAGGERARRVRRGPHATPARRDGASGAHEAPELGAARRTGARGAAGAARAGADGAVRRALRARGTRTGRGDRGPHGKVSGEGASRPGHACSPPPGRARDQRRGGSTRTSFPRLSI